MLDERIAQEIKEMQQRLLAEGELPTPARLQQYYDNFRERFGPNRLASLDGQALLEYMHGSSNPDSLVYWLEFKNDDEFSTILFGGIAGGSALKFGVYRGAHTGIWMTRDKSNYPMQIPIEEAIDIARKHRAQLLRGLELLEELPDNSTDEDYRVLQAKMDAEAPDVSRLAWGHKYFSLFFPDKLDNNHVEAHQRFQLIKLLQVPPEGDGRYLCAGRFAAIARELQISLNHLTAVLNRRDGKPHNYWRILSNYQKRQDWRNWELMRDGGFVGIGWANIGDLSDIEPNLASKQRVGALMREHYNAKGPWSQEVFNFVARMESGDIVLAFEKNTVLGIGEITGPYFFEPASPLAHRRPVKWLSVVQWETPVDEFSRTNPTVREVKQYRNLVEAERRILEAKYSPAPPVSRTRPQTPRLEGIPGRIQAILNRKGQVILYGPPGTGKTYWAEQTARDLAALNIFDDLYAALSVDQQQRITTHYVKLCSFHPSYGYEDFLEGYRPELVNGQMTFVRRDGIFKRLCDVARTEPDRNFYLIIDEINRGDIPRIFGELLTVLEKDKRGKAILLPVSERAFEVPRNVYIIGTMNTADRSIALLDTALRRRFGFLELMPDYGVLENAAIEGIPLAPWLKALNQRIVEHVGRDARNLQIGHAYLLHDGKPIASFARFARIVQEDIIPLLEEYCYEDYDTLESILGRGLVDVQSQTINHDLFDPARQDELVQALLASSPEITTSLQAAVSDQALEEDEVEDEDGDINGEEADA